MFSNYHTSLVVTGLALACHTIATLTGNFSIWPTLYYLASPVCFLLLGVWFYQEYQLQLLRKALDSLIGSKATQAELPPKQYH